MVEINSRKASLIAEIEVSRGEMRQALQQCEESLDFAGLMSRSVRTNPMGWLFGAAMVGLSLSQILWRPQRASVKGQTGFPEKGREAGSKDTVRREDDRSAVKRLVIGFCRLGFDLLKPALTEWTIERFSSVVRSKFPIEVPNRGNRGP